MATEAATFRVVLEGVSKRFGRQWILTDRNEDFESGRVYGVGGANGSGKSTLLRLLAGQLTPSRGKVRHMVGDRAVEAGEVYRHVSLTAPYLELPEELTVTEILRFHFSLKPSRGGLRPPEMVDRLHLRFAAHRKLVDCSSGMRQRVMLGTALYAATPLLLLDEPTLTLDEDATRWFRAEFDRFRADRLVIIASNAPTDLDACDQLIRL